MHSNRSWASQFLVSVSSSETGNSWGSCGRLLVCAGHTPAGIAERLARAETAVLGRLIASGLAHLQPTSRPAEKAS